MGGIGETCEFFLVIPGSTVLLRAVILSLLLAKDLPGCIGLTCRVLAFRPMESKFFVKEPYRQHSRLKHRGRSFAKTRLRMTDLFERVHAAKQFVGIPRYASE